MKLCECGCGLPAPLSDKTTRARGYIQGQPRRFIQGHYRPARTTSTYPMRSRPTHPKAAHGCVAEHVLIAEQALGRYLPEGAEVHHVDGCITNNAQGNLVICQDKAYHKLLHFRERIVRAGGDPDTQKICSTCRTLKPIAEFNRSKRSIASGVQTQCRACSSAYTRTYVRPSKRTA